MRVHLISRAICASTPTSCTTIGIKWHSLFRECCAKPRANLFSLADAWILDKADFELYSKSQALALFEILLIGTAPAIFENDKWVRIMCGFNAPWVAATPVKFPHPNALLGLLRTGIGARLVSYVESLEWTHPCVNKLEELQNSPTGISWESDVLTIETSSLGPIWRSGAVVMLSASVNEPWPELSLLSVNTNGIKRNGRNLIEKVIARYHIVCIQETKFRNLHHVSKFQFHLSSSSSTNLLLAT